MLSRNLLWAVRRATITTMVARTDLDRGPALAEARRMKYTQNTGVKGIRSKKSAHDAVAEQQDVWLDDTAVASESDDLNLTDREYDDMARTAMYVSRDISSSSHNVVIIQPYVKWGPKQEQSPVTPDDQLNEAVALVHSLPNWQVALSLKVPLETLERKALFGTGKLLELKQLVQDMRATTRPSCLFISKGTLSFAQKRTLESEFQLPVMDRYSVVIHILRLHATTAEARLQVAMAEIPYIWAQAKDANQTAARKQGYALNDAQRALLQTRERKLKNKLDDIRNHRQLLRNKRKQKNYPVVAVVGYTNAGKTSLIKALTAEQRLQPRDQLFATLDVTAHMGVLPCNLQVLYMDTVGFMSDLPTGLIECFIATLEDAMLADVIVHVQDLSHACCHAQQQHVLKTLHTLTLKLSASHQLPPIINVGNKVDLLQPVAAAVVGTADSDRLLVSAQQQTGLPALLLQIEYRLLAVTGRRKLCIRVPNGGVEMAWLHKNTAVTAVRCADDTRPEHLLLDVVITEKVLQEFKRQFCR